MPGYSTIGYLRVFEGHPAKRHHKLGMSGDRLPRGLLDQQPKKIPGNIGHGHIGRGVAVGIYGTDKATEEIEEAMQLSLGEMEGTGTAPAVRAGINRPVPVGAPDTFELGGHKIKRPLPTERDKGLAPTSTTTRSVSEPAFPHHGLADAERVIDRLYIGAPERRGVRVFGRGIHGNQTTLRDPGCIAAPVEGGTWIRSVVSDFHGSGLFLCDRRAKGHAGVPLERRQ